MRCLTPDDVEVPSQDQLNRLLFTEFLNGHREARRGRQLTRVVIFIAVGYFAAGGYIIDRQNDRAAKLVKQVTKQAQSAETLATAVQASRLEFIRRSCEGTNQRHDATIQALNRNIARLPPGKRLSEARKKRPGTVLIIKAAVPHRDCDAVVRRARLPD